VSGGKTTKDDTGAFREPAIILVWTMLQRNSDALILVDEADRSLGFLSKRLCHEGQGVLHRAIFIADFYESGELFDPAARRVQRFMGRCIGSN